MNVHLTQNAQLVMGRMRRRQRMFSWPACPFNLPIPTATVKRSVTPIAQDSERSPLIAITRAGLMTACDADKRCSLNLAKDLATKQFIPMGCGYIKGACGQALTCYTNKLTGIRVMANSVCETPFPEWEDAACTEADYEAAKTP